MRLLKVIIFVSLSLGILRGKMKVISSTYGGFTVEIEAGPIRYEQVERNGEYFTRLYLPGGGHTADVGKAEVPVISRLFAVPKGARINIDVEILETEKIEGILVYPAQEPAIDKEGYEPPPFTMDKEFYQSDLYYPSEWAAYTQRNRIRGIEVSSLILAPLRYNPKKREIIFAKRMRVHVHFKGGGSFYEDRLRSPFMEPLLKRILLNNNVLGNFRGRSKSLDGADLIIVIPDALRDSIIPLAEWRHYSGIATRVVTLSEIGTNPTADDIRDYIKNAYENWLLPPTFVMIVGDADMVPTHYKYIHPSTGEWIGTDVYYGEMDEEYNPPFPDLFVGRISVEDETQLGIYVRKVLTYDKNPPTDTEWLNRLLLAAYNESGRYFIATSESIYVYLNPLGYDINRQYEGGNPPGSTQGVIDAINNGVFIANHRDHGSSRNSGSGADGWSHPSFNTTHVPQLSNGDYYPLFFSINCESGWFDGETDDYPSWNYECLGEELLRKPTGGAIGFVGATRISYSGYNDELDKGFFDAIWPGFDPSYPGGGSVNPLDGPLYYLGGIINYGKFWMYDKYVMTGGSGYPWSPSPPYTRTEFEEFNLQGDPALALRTAMPESLLVSHPDAVPIGYSEVTITVNTIWGPVEGARVALVQLDTVVYSVGYTNSAGQVTLSIEPTSPDIIHLTVTAPNALPYEADIQPFSEGPYISFLSLIVDDDSSGTSYGNGNGLANPGEIIELPMWLMNWGSDSATGVVALLRSQDPNVTVTDSIEEIGTVQPEDSVQTPDDFDVTLGNSLTNGSNISFELIVTSAEGDTWVSHPGIIICTPVLGFDSFYVITADSSFDPGDTVEVVMILRNTGLDVAEGAEVTVRTSDTLLVIIDSTSIFPQINPDSTAEGTPLVMFAPPETPVHHEVPFEITITSGQYEFVDSFTIVVGRGGQFLVWDPDPNHTSGPIIASILGDSLGLQGDYTTDLNSYILELPYYTALFVCVGIYPDNYVISSGSGEALAIEEYLNSHGGRVYLEGGDVWYWDPTHGGHNFNSIFGINPVSDGTGDLGTVQGIPGTFTEGLTYTYVGENSWIDRLMPVGNGFSVLQNLSPPYFCGIANVDTVQGLEYRTVGTSFELGGLAGTVSTKRELLEAICEFFGIDLVGIKESEGISSVNYTLALLPPSPNPSMGDVKIIFTLPKKEKISLKAYNVAGRLVDVILRGTLEPGLHRVVWSRKVPSGLYFIRLEAGDKNLTRRVIRLR
jgi:hypothetical protein